ncbi:hypothetical protein ACUNV4_08685 [Granulosicoccus sp. 3-233]|uniref:hypothetical protein n=1 Tax=Granulosicoccus sp. 3-233 TaxID=3417969 RepID=UPI003D35657E
MSAGSARGSAATLENTELLEGHYESDNTNTAASSSSNSTINSDNGFNYNKRLAVSGRGHTFHLGELGLRCHPHRTMAIACMGQHATQLSTVFIKNSPDCDQLRIARNKPPRCPSLSILIRAGMTRAASRDAAATDSV